jgi:16S rRNA (uracil1498-N3)-methyltransferase
VLPRFYAPQIERGARSIVLDADESHHLVHVLRLKAADTVRVFDGRGGEWQGRLVSCDKRGAAIDALEPIAPLPEAEVAVTLVVGLLRGPAMHDLVRDATMLGAHRVVPVYTERTAVSKRRDVVPVARWRRIAITSCKQCGRAVVPEIAEPLPFSEAIQREAGVRLMLVEPTAAIDGRCRVDDLAAPARQGGALIAVGPEGGWTDAEVRLAVEAGYVPWSLGTQVLRAEAVPLAALSVLRYAWSS